MRKINILGWVLLPLNIIGLFFCVYSLQTEINILYLLGTGFFVAQFIYVVKTLKALEQFEVTRKRLESAARKAGLTMAKLLKEKKEN